MLLARATLVLPAHRYPIEHDKNSNQRELQGQRHDWYRDQLKGDPPKPVVRLRRKHVIIHTTGEPPRPPKDP